MRIDNIHQALKQFHVQNPSSKETLLPATASQLSQTSGYTRTAVSEELSELVRKDQVVKVKSRPVLFFDKDYLEEQFPFFKSSTCYDSLASLQEDIYQQTEQIHKKKQLLKMNPFANVIGFDGSLADAIKKLKAAILYPPNGLNILLTGESGVGKTLIAEQLHQFYQVKMNQEVPFIYFNCAEYFNNPELLTSHLFGYKKGSFTGAVNDQKGLVELADGGFLFLDEVHRLTSEGQEKLFTVLDKGYFTRMGEAEKQRNVSIKFIFATTEAVNQHFLKTFLRRIPVTLAIPALAERSMKEKIQLILSFFLEESQRIQKNIHIRYEALKQLTFTHFEANVGELKAAIQFMSAQAYLEVFDQLTETICIEANEGTVKEQPDVESLLAFNEWIPNDGLTIQYNHFYLSSQELLKSESLKNDRFYNFLLKEYADLKKLTLSTEDALAIMQNKVEQLYDMDIFAQEPLAIEAIDETLQPKIQEAIVFFEQLIQEKLTEDFQNILIVHLYSAVFYSAQMNETFYSDTKNIYSGKVTQYQAAKTMVDFLQTLFGISFADTEILFFDLFIRKVTAKKRAHSVEENCGVIVVAHGAATASSMVEYTNLLFSTTVMRAVDMPINQSVEETLEKVRTIVKQNQYKKIILMVDIGSLVYFGNAISQTFQMEVLLISNINLLTLLEVAREVIYESTAFEYLLPVLKEKNHRALICSKGRFNEAKVLIISCLTGMGTAIKIEQLLLKTFPNELLTNVRIITLEKREVEDIDRLHSFVRKEEKIVGIIGTVKTEVPDIPFISLQDLLSKRGIQLVFELLGHHLEEKQNQELLKKVSAKYIQGLSIEAITDLLTVLNPTTISIELAKIYSDICLQTKIKSDEKILLRFIIHCACMLERQLLNPEYDPTAYEVSYRELPEAVSVIKMAFRPIEVSYNLLIPPLEVRYIYELLFEKA